MWVWIRISWRTFKNTDFCFFYLVSLSCCCCCWVASALSDSVRPHRRQPTRLLCLWDSPGKNNGVGCHFLLQCMKVERESEVTQLGPKNCVSNKFSGNAHVACSRITLSDPLPNTIEISIFFFWVIKTWIQTRAYSLLNKITVVKWPKLWVSVYSSVK